MGVPTGVLTPIVEKQLTKVIVDAESRVKKDDFDLDNQSLHATKKPIKFALAKKFPQGALWVPM